MWTIFVILHLILIVLACLFFIPHATTSIDITLEMEKTNAGTVLDTIPIIFTGTWEKYLLQKDRLVLTVSEFDHYYNIRPLDTSTPYFSLQGTHDYYSVCFLANSTITGEDSVFLFVRFTKDLSGWSIRSMANPNIPNDHFKGDPSFFVSYDYNWQLWE